jgi:superfamily I DNA and/or RNA helicase
MSISKRRIILVGDHKQMPNIVNEDIVNEIENEIGSTDPHEKIKEHFKITMFQMLINKARELEKKDGHKRVITLNKQFRMHPELGNIVSNYFYKEEGGLSSPRPASHFAHRYYGLKDKYLYWIDVPWNKAEIYRNQGSTSRKNRLEAEKIAYHIEEALNDESYNKETIGIITFYKDQVETIKEALRKRRIINEHGEPTGNYIGLELLVGTVDAFQGKEFDVVYLSMTYTFDVTNQYVCNKEAYSRLVMDNLLNVAISRQKKLLICVGDQKVFSYEKAKTHVPCLYDLAVRCMEDGLHE